MGLETGSKGKKKSHVPNVSLKRKRGSDDLEQLQEKVQAIDLTEDVFETFEALPLSQPTANGLESSHFKTLTDVQKSAIPRALCGHDILGAAKTGSGKTLAFLIPVLENLYRRTWSELDGLGAMILAPTRELAVQIFEVLRKVGRYHTFSAGLVIGGKSLQEERDRLGRMDILVCTPGRILQHMDQTVAFDVGNLQMLVLDEADRILDMGFQNTVDAIVEHLPKSRQTMLFSATQTKKVSDLARLSLNNPQYVSVHEDASSATPATLQQNYIVVPLADKMSTLWSFLRANLKAKILVFFSAGKQVKFAYEAFRHMQPGLSLLHLHGRQKQPARLEVTTKFHRAKYACLFATDVAARGLDFPAVDWVVQVDCPEDADTYIHRVGRTARYEHKGRAVLFLDPSEEPGMTSALERHKVVLEKINVRHKKQQDIQGQLQNMCFKDPELKYLGQKAFVSYARSIHVQRSKDIFQLDRLDLEKYANNLGLPGAPRIKFQKADEAKRLKNKQYLPAYSSSEEGDDADLKENGHSKTIQSNAPRTKYDRMFERKNQDVLADHYLRLIDGERGPKKSRESQEDGEEGFLNVKRRLSIDSSETNGEDNKQQDFKAVKLTTNGLPIAIDSKRREKLIRSKKKVAQLKEKGKKLVFDDDGNAREIYELEGEDKFHASGPVAEQKTKFLNTEKSRLEKVDLDDKATVKARRKAEKEKRKAKEAALAAEHRADDGPDAGVTLVPYEEAVSASPVDESHLGHHSDAQDVHLDAVPKRPRKWFEDDPDENARNAKDHGRRVHEVDELENIEDLEAVASRFLQ